MKDPFDTPLTRSLRDVRKNAPAYESRYVAFIDVLGWKEKVKESAKDMAALSALAEASEVMSLPSQLSRLLSEVGEVPDACKGQFMSSQFSDNVVMSVPAVEGASKMLVPIVMQLCQQLLKDGFYPRGGIAVGPLVHLPRVVYGQGLVDAFLLESTVAKVPRIVIGPGALDAVGPFVKADSDGLDYLDMVEFLIQCDDQPEAKLRWFV